MGDDCKRSKKNLVFYSDCTLPLSDRWRCFVTGPSPSSGGQESDRKKSNAHWSHTETYLFQCGWYHEVYSCSRSRDGHVLALLNLFVEETALARLQAERQ